jgi:hypothetical protein
VFRSAKQRKRQGGSVVHLSRLSALAVAGAVPLLVAPGGAAAKERVTATIHAPTRCDAVAGHRITVAFQLTSWAQGTPQPFGAGGVFVVLRRFGAKPGVKRAATSAGSGTGRYTARVTVPRGGIRRIDVGLEGTASTPGGATRDADVLFRVVGDPCRLAR